MNYEEYIKWLETNDPDRARLAKGEISESEYEEFLMPKRVHTKFRIFTTRMTCNSRIRFYISESFMGIRHYSPLPRTRINVSWR